MARWHELINFGTQNLKWLELWENKNIRERIKYNIWQQITEKYHNTNSHTRRNIHINIQIQIYMEDKYTRVVCYVCVLCSSVVLVRCFLTISIDPFIAASLDFLLNADQLRWSMARRDRMSSFKGYHEPRDPTTSGWTCPRCSYLRTFRVYAASRFSEWS